MCPENVILHAQADHILQLEANAGEGPLRQNVGGVEWFYLVASQALRSLSVQDDGLDPGIGFLHQLLMGTLAFHPLASTVPVCSVSFSW